MDRESEQKHFEYLTRHLRCARNEQQFSLQHYPVHLHLQQLQRERAVLQDTISESGSSNSNKENSCCTKFCNRFLDFCTYMSFTIFVLLLLGSLLVSLHYFLSDYYKTDELRYENMRNKLLRNENERRLGKNSAELSTAERLANERLLALKTIDNQLFEKGKLKLHEYGPKPHFFSKYSINETDLYGLLHSMPKGGLLHVHDSGMFKTELLIELSHQQDLWVCVSLHGDFEQFRFSKYFPKPVKHEDYACVWQLMQDFWRYNNPGETDEKLRKILRLDMYETMSRAELNRKLKKINRLVEGLITFKRVWENYIFRMLRDFYYDGVMYVELRTSLPILYDLEKSNYTILDTAATIVTVSKIFNSRYSGFLGTKIIYAPVRDSNKTQDLQIYLNNARLLKKTYPKFFIGFDFPTLDDECQAPTLRNYAINLLHINKEIDFYFHAGESICYNSTNADDNLIDAILLGSKRIGNNLNLPHHPEVLRIMDLMNVAVEICPLSNHYRQFINDFETHPAAYLIAAGYPIVVGSDYPYYWNAAPLTDDFYVAFVGIATNSGNIALLKQLAMNSLLYSGMQQDEKKEALDIWLESWNYWVEEFVVRRY